MIKEDDAYDLGCVILCIYRTYETMQHTVETLGLEVRRVRTYDTVSGIIWCK